MTRFIEHFGEMGPRWGLERETCRAHALLFLAGQPMGLADLARALNLTKAKAGEAIADLEQWGMARSTSEAAWDASGEPWDLLFAALDARRRRELQPALDMLREGCKAAAGDGTPSGVRQRLGRMLALVEDLAAIDVQTRRLPSTALIHLVGLGGRAARFLGRTFPSSRDRSRS
jgi:DNA-binding transcriptional regulator GbsR (MarR family)